METVGVSIIFRDQMTSPSNNELLPFFRDQAADSRGKSGDVKALSQYCSPAWVGPELWRAYFSDVPTTATICEPTAGRGHLLAAVPSEYPSCFGVEIDPDLAAVAAQSSGRRVLIGDFLTLDLPAKSVDVFFGNPPFQAEWMEGFLDRADYLMPDGGRAGLILPAYMLQTSATVLRWAQRFSISQEMLPRDLFPNLSLPLVFAVLSKDQAPKLVGLRLYRELADVKSLEAGFQRFLVTAVVPNGGVWKAAVDRAFDAAGGKAELPEFYSFIGPNRPTTNSFWREQVRKVLQTHYLRVERGVYIRPETQAA